MPNRSRRPVLALITLALALAVAACASSAPPPASTISSAGAPSLSAATPAPTAAPSSPPPTPAGSETTIRGQFLVDGAEMFLECRGVGSPTVLYEAGLGGSSSHWDRVIDDLSPTTRACRYDRPGLGHSDPRPGVGALSVGDRARDLHSLLDAAGVDGPFVLVGWSYGGPLIRAFTAAYPGESSGLVFLDASHEDQFDPDGWWMRQQPDWTDGAHVVDTARSRDELRQAGDLGDRPTIVLTNGLLNGELERQWTPLQDAIAGLSSNSLHMVATQAGHNILGGREDLVVASVLAVVEAVRGTPLPPCGPDFEALGAECLEGTMGDLLAAWDADRAAVVPAAGDLPAGRYTFDDDGATITIRLRDGRIRAEIRNTDGSEESFTAVYAADDDQATFVWPFDLRYPRTPGINTARWSVAEDGSLTFEQLDDQREEPWLAGPWMPAARSVP